MKRLLILPLVLFAGCGSTDLVGNELEAQKERAKTIITEPDKVIDGIVQDELQQRGVDGQAPPVPGSP